MSTSVLITFIRHAESTDNLQPIWAGWKDAPLSNHGMNQAHALAEFFADTRFTAIYASDLKRASTTAQALYKQQKDPKPTYVSSELLREQNFGIAEGKPFSRRRDPYDTPEAEMKSGLYLPLRGLDEKYPGGESLLDLAERSKKAITQLLLPHMQKVAKEGSTGIHVAVVSHGLCLGEMISELLKMSANQAVETKYDGLENTAWTRVVINIEESQSIDADQHPLMVMQVTDVNRHSHLNTLIRQRGGIGSAAFDPEQRDIREFFGGARTSVANGKDITDNA